MAHNAVFDMAWMLRDFNPNAKYYSDYRLFNFVGCTYGMYRHLASEGFQGQKWSLDYAQRTLLNIESNKVERNKQLVLQGILRKPIKAELLRKLCKEDVQACSEYNELVQHNLNLSKPDSEDEEDDHA